MMPSVSSTNFVMVENSNFLTYSIFFACKSNCSVDNLNNSDNLSVETAVLPSMQNEKSMAELKCISLSLILSTRGLGKGLFLYN